jgi:hypothetical protein
MFQAESHWKNVVPQYVANIKLVAPGQVHRGELYIIVRLLHVLKNSRGVCRLLRDFQEITFNGASIGIILPGHLHPFISSKNVNGRLLAAAISNFDPPYRHIFEEDILPLSQISISEFAEWKTDHFLSNSGIFLSHAGALPNKEKS